MEDIFEKLEKIIEMRQNERPENSYVAELWKKGNDFILKKIGEESAELIIASKNKNEDEILNELPLELVPISYLLVAFAIQETKFCVTLVPPSDSYTDVFLTLISTPREPPVFLIVSP